VPTALPVDEDLTRRLPLTLTHLIRQTCNALDELRRHRNETNPLLAPRTVPRPGSRMAGSRE
jgi:hypothetical protein